MPEHSGMSPLLPAQALNDVPKHQRPVVTLSHGCAARLLELQGQDLRGGLWGQPGSQDSFWELGCRSRGQTAPGKAMGWGRWEQEGRPETRQRDVERRRRGGERRRNRGRRDRVVHREERKREKEADVGYLELISADTARETAPLCGRPSSTTTSLWLPPRGLSHTLLWDHSSQGTAPARESHLCRFLPPLLGEEEGPLKARVPR